MPALAAFLLALPLAGCPPCDDADVHLARGDTSAAVAALRGAADAGHPAAVGELAWLLVQWADAGRKGPRDYIEAERALDRAEAALPGDPRWLFARAILLWKQGSEDDAGLVLTRALDALDLGALDDGRRAALLRVLTDQLPPAAYRQVVVHALDAVEHSLPAHERLSFLLHLAAIQEWRAWPERHLPSRHDRFVAGRLCADDLPCPDGSGARPIAPADAGRANDGRTGAHMDEATLIAPLYSRAFEADPASAQAARGHLAELSRSGEWPRFLSAARRHAALAPDRGWPLLFVATGLWETLRYAEADSVFREGLALLDPAERAYVEDISMALKPSHQEALLDASPRAREVLSGWLLQVSDPFFLTPYNEKRLAFLARLALAELWFGEGWNGLRGARTDRGLILIRYGEPTSVWRLEGTPEEARSSLAACDGPRASCTWDEGTVGIRWSYGDWGREFLFLKSLRERTTRHSPASAASEHRLSEIEPSNMVFPMTHLAHQVARFKGRSAAADVDVDVHVALPYDSTMDVRRPGRTALFFLPRTPLEELIRLESETPLGWAPGTTTFRFEMDRGQYVYSAESMTEDQGLRAGARERLEIEAFAGAAPMLSDIVLARSIEPQREAPRTRHELRIRPAADLLYAPGEPLALYFEIYHLSASDGSARYRVELEVRDPSDRGLLARVARGVVGLFSGEGDSGRIRWERTLDVYADRVPEWFQLRLPGAPHGTHTVRVTVTDLATGKAATAERRFRVGPRWDPLAER